MKDIKRFILERKVNDYKFNSKDGKFNLDEVITALSEISRSTGYDKVHFGCHSYSTKDVGLCRYKNTVDNILKFDINNNKTTNVLDYDKVIEILDNIDSKEISFVIENKEKVMKSHKEINTVKSFKIVESLGNAEYIDIIFDIL